MTTKTIKPNDGPTATNNVTGGDYVQRLVRCEGCEIKMHPDESNTVDSLALDGTHQTHEFCDECVQGMKDEERASIDGILGSSLADQITKYSPNDEVSNAKRSLD